MFNPIFNICRSAIAFIVARFSTVTGGPNKLVHARLSIRSGLLLNPALLGRRSGQVQHSVGQA